MEFKFSKNIRTMKPSAIREILKYASDPSVISLAAGNPSPEAFPIGPIRALADSILRETPFLALQYSVTEGHAPLIEAIKAFAKKRHSIGRDLDACITTSGGQQAVELACKVLCDPGDTIICENPSFIGSLNAFRSYGVNLVGIDMDSDGMKPDELEAALKSCENVKVIYVIPNFQNPSGICTSLERRKQIYELAKKYDVVIIEDNPYGELRFSGSDIPSIKALDDDGRVVYCGSFSKIIAPAIRVGYVIAHKDLTPKMVVGKQCEDVHTNMLAQMICERFLKEYDFDDHIAKIRGLYKHKCELMVSAIEKNFSSKITFTKPEGGLFIYCTMPEGSDMLEFCSVAVKSGVAVVPGTAFLADENAPCYNFRLNFTTPPDELIVKGIEILGRLTKAHLG